MCAIVVPFTTRLDELAGRDCCRMGDDGDEMALAARLYPQYAEAVLVIMERHSLDEAGEEFRGRISVCGYQSFVGLRS
jgi:hypothetical protein